MTRRQQVAGIAAALSMGVGFVAGLAVTPPQEQPREADLPLVTCQRAGGSDALVAWQRCTFRTEATPAVVYVRPYEDGSARIAVKENAR